MKSSILHVPTIQAFLKMYSSESDQKQYQGYLGGNEDSISHNDNLNLGTEMCVCVGGEGGLKETEILSPLIPLTHQNHVC